MDLTVSIAGEWASLAAAFAWAGSTFLYRFYGDVLRATWITLFKGIVALVFLVLTVQISGGFTPVTLTQYVLLAVSGVIGISLGDTAFFMALPKVGGSLTSAIQCLAPPLTAIGAIYFLDEHLTVKQWGGLAVTCAGVAAMILTERPPRAMALVEPISGFKAGILWALVAALCQAVGVLMSRQPLQGLGPAEGAVHRIFFAVIVVLFWEWYRSRRSVTYMIQEAISIPYKGRLALAAFLGTYVGLILMVYGMTHAPVGISLAICSSYPILVTILEYIFMRKRLQLRSLFCLFLSIGGLFVMLH